MLLICCRHSLLYRLLPFFWLGLEPSVQPLTSCRSPKGARSINLSFRPPYCHWHSHYCCCCWIVRTTAAAAGEAGLSVSSFLHISVHLLLRLPPAACYSCYLYVNFIHCCLHSSCCRIVTAWNWGVFLLYLRKGRFRSPGCALLTFFVFILYLYTPRSMYLDFVFWLHLTITVMKRAAFPRRTEARPFVFHPSAATSVVTPYDGTKRKRLGTHFAISNRCRIKLNSMGWLSHALWGRRSTESAGPLGRTGLAGCDSHEKGVILNTRLLSFSAVTAAARKNVIVGGGQQTNCFYWLERISRGMVGSGRHCGNWACSRFSCSLRRTDLFNHGSLIFLSSGSHERQQL